LRAVIKRLLDEPLIRTPRTASPSINNCSTSVPNRISTFRASSEA
jgi:hypothetical protein